MRFYAHAALLGEVHPKPVGRNFWCYRRRPTLPRNRKPSHHQGDHTKSSSPPKPRLQDWTSVGLQSSLANYGLIRCAAPAVYSFSFSRMVVPATGGAIPRLAFTAAAAVAELVSEGGWPQTNQPPATQTISPNFHSAHPSRDYLLAQRAGGKRHCFPTVAVAPLLWIALRSFTSLWLWPLLSPPPTAIAAIVAHTTHCVESASAHLTNYARQQSSFDWSEVAVPAKATPNLRNIKRSSQPHDPFSSPSTPTSSASRFVEHNLDTPSAAITLRRSSTCRDEGRLPPERPTPHSSADDDPAKPVREELQSTARRRRQAHHSALQR